MKLLNYKSLGLEIVHWGASLRDSLCAVSLTAGEMHVWCDLSGPLFYCSISLQPGFLFFRGIDTKGMDLKPLGHLM